MGLLDFLQSASNAVAGNVAGPVDLIALGLNKAGLPIREPVLGSEWMKKRGLMTDVPMGAARIAGETVGLLGPTVIAQKAPQIARGLLQGAENLAAPRTLNPQTGAIVWHGSPHKFDRFDSSKIGTGEGAQAYGHGLYLAESPDVAGAYLRAGRDLGFNNRDDVGRLADKAFAQASGDTQKAMSILDELASKTSGRSLRNNALLAKQSLAKGTNNSALYKVDLPDTAIAKMLDWDKPLSQQAPRVQDALMTTLQKSLKPYRAVDGSTRYMATIGGQQRAFASEADAMAALSSELDGASAYLLSGGGSQSSNQLARQGIPGIRYLDGGSRGAGQGTYNYVVFPGEEGLLTILERNGQRLTK